MTGLSVGHSLHCLDQLRKSLWPERYNNSIWKPDGTFDYMTFGHFDHCIDMLRQSLLCACDITPIVYHWNTRLNQTRAHFDTMRTCRNCVKIMDWASDHSFATTIVYNNKDRFVKEGDHVPTDSEPDLASFKPVEDFASIEASRRTHLTHMCSAG